MLQIGRKIYYEKANGVIVWDKGEMSGDVVETTLEQDEVTMPILSALDTKGQLGILQLDYGAQANSFATCKGYYINVSDNSVVFLTGAEASTTESTTTTTTDSTASA
jgi:hypothetical protein